MEEGSGGPCSLRGTDGIAPVYEVRMDAKAWRRKEEVRHLYMFAFQVDLNLEPWGFFQTFGETFWGAGEVA